MPFHIFAIPAAARRSLLFLLVAAAFGIATTPAHLHAATGTIANQIKLKALIIPSVDFNETPLEDAIEYLRQKSDELDKDGFGINIVVDSEIDRNQPIPSLSLKNAPLSAVLGYVCELTGNRYRVDRNAIIIFRPRAKSSGDQETAENTPPPPPAPKPTTASMQLRAKLDQIVIPSIDFYDTPLPDAVEFLRQKAAQLDPTGSGAQGVNFVIAGTLPDPPPTITLKLQQVPLSDVLKYVTGLADMRYDISAHAVTIRAR
ncbi:MAG: DUF4974 domain-containing protein [Verrucomicrobiota bacterium]